MSSQEITMDAGEIEKWVEQHSAATAQWSAKEINEAEEASELKPSGMDTTTEAHPLEHSGTAGLTEMMVWGTCTTVGNYTPAMNHHRRMAKQGLEPIQG